MLQKFFVLALILFLQVVPVHADGEDKVLHGVGSFVISTAAYNIYLSEFEMEKNHARFWAFVTTMAIGAIKETIDDDFDGGDMAANAGGALAGVAIGFEF